MEIIERINNVIKNYECDGLSYIWQVMSSKSSVVHPYSLNDFENMDKNDMTYGFYGSAPEEHIKYILNLLAQSIGSSGINNSEGGQITSFFSIENKSVDEILNQIQIDIGFNFTFPKFIGGFSGIQTLRGILTPRDCHYLYLAKKVVELCPDRNSKILEIGAGMGLLGFYLDNLGYRNFSIVDLPKVNAVQTYFLSFNLPHRKLILTDEVENPFSEKYNEFIKILHYKEFNKASKNSFDLIINIDSLTEMCIEDAQNYLNLDCSKLFLSINHEGNSYRVFDIKKKNLKLKSRHLFGVRKGYVEELYERL